MDFEVSQHKDTAVLDRHRLTFWQAIAAGAVQDSIAACVSQEKPTTVIADHRVMVGQMTLSVGDNPVAAFTTAYCSTRSVERLAA
ncbi:hypothetical protein D3C81_1587830 [compost metagenome]